MALVKLEMAALMDGEMNDIEKYLWRAVQDLQGKVQVLETVLCLMQHTLEGYRTLLYDDIAGRKVEQLPVVDKQEIYRRQYAKERGEVM